MSYNVFFDFSISFSKPMKVPKNTLDLVNDHIKRVEEKLKLTRVKYENNPWHWEKNNYDGVDDEVLCETVMEHNDFVRVFFKDVKNWHNTPPSDFEIITPEQSREFFPGLQILDVEPERWTNEYYRNKMDVLYEVMRGRETDGISFDTKKLTEKQAANVIILFSEFLDGGDIRLDVPKGCDHLEASYDGGYEWCIKHGAVLYEDINELECSKCKYRDTCDIVLDD